MERKSEDLNGWVTRETAEVLRLQWKMGRKKRPSYRAAKKFTLRRRGNEGAAVKPSLWGVSRTGSRSGNRTRRKSKESGGLAYRK